jgi:chemotaxis signal transduction protein
MKKSFLTFALSGYHFAVPKNGAQEIIHYNPFKTEQLASNPTLVFYDWSEPFPVINTRVKLGMKPIKKNDNACILLDHSFKTENQYLKVGFLMDYYLGGFSVSSREIISTKNRIEEYIQGTCIINSNVHFIISLPQLLLDQTIKDFDPFRQHNAEYTLIPD